jgi:hypothetical protein
MTLSDAEAAVVRKVLLSDHVQLAIGAENWSLTLEEENILWTIIRRLEQEEG